jgi:predicted Fe-Mo cluster-binding NifX family protein
MKIVISSNGPSLDSEVDPRFGRCQYFLVVDLDDMSFEALPNENLARGSGVGIQSAKLVADRGIKAVLTGNIGPNAYDVLGEVGVEVITGVSGVVREKAQQYKNGELRPNNQASTQVVPGLQANPNQSPRPLFQQTSNAGPGIGRGMGMGRGTGGGRGMRCGCGKRGSRGMRMERGTEVTPSVPTDGTSLGKMTREDELAYLKQDSRMLHEEMQAIERRIKELENEDR